MATINADLYQSLGLNRLSYRIARSRLLYLKRREAGNIDVLKRILEDSKKHKKSKPQKIHVLGTNRRTINKRKDIEKDQRKTSKGSGGRVERRNGEEELLRDIYIYIYRRFKKK